MAPYLTIVKMNELKIKLRLYDNDEDEMDMDSKWIGFCLLVKIDLPVQLIYLPPLAFLTLSI